eukprot:1891826-Alexandrium_andersonii.AAC.1
MAIAWVSLATPDAAEEAKTMLGFTCSTANPAPGADPPPRRGGKPKVKTRDRALEHEALRHLRL